MPQASEGDTVHVHYTGRLADGSQFDTSLGSDPLKFTVGDGQVIAGFDAAVRGMEPGQSKTEEIPADQAYGPRDDELLFAMRKEDIPDDIEVEVGMGLRMTSEDGHVLEARVMRIDGDVVVMDANHPLAGKDLTFEIELLEIG